MSGSSYMRQQIRKTVSPLHCHINQEEKNKGNLFNRAIDIVSGIFQPILGVMSACGMLKGFNALFLALGLYKSSSGISILLNGIGDALFMFLPLFLGFTSAKKFNLKPMLGLAIGAAMCYPALQLSTLSKCSRSHPNLLSGVPCQHCTKI